MKKNKFTSILILFLVIFSIQSYAQNVLIIWDTKDYGTLELKTYLEEEGYNVTLSDTIEYLFDGTNPSLDDFNAVIHLNGVTYSSTMTEDGQTALLNYVKGGGGFISSEWNAYQAGDLTIMRDLILFDRSGGSGITDGTYKIDSAYSDHMIFEGIEEDSTFSAHHNIGELHDFSVDTAVVLADLYNGVNRQGAGIAIREFQDGRIVSLSHAGNYDQTYETLSDALIQKLYSNAVRWVAGVSIDGEQRAIIGVPDIISFKIVENDTILNWYKRTIDDEWAVYAGPDTTIIEIYNEPDTFYYKVEYIRDSDTITTSDFEVIAKYAQTITFPQLPEMALDQEDYDPGATASSELMVTYSSSDTSIAEIIDGKIHPKMVDTCIIYVNQEGDNNYWPAEQVADTLIIKAASQTITFDALPAKTYGDADFDPGAFSSSGLEISYSSSDTSIAKIADGNIHIVSAGTCTIYADQEGNDTLTVAVQVEQLLEIGKAEAMLSIMDTVYVYDGSAKSVSTTTTPSDLMVTVTYDESETAPSDAGSYAVVATIDDVNYYGMSMATLEIGKAEAMLSIMDTVYVYDGSAKSVSTTTTPSDLMVTVTYDESGTAPSDAGSYAVVATIDDVNYYGMSMATLEIAKAVAMVAITDTVHVHDGSAKSATVTTTPSDLMVTVTYDGSETVPSDVGTYVVIATIDETNYLGADTATFEITESTGVNGASIAEMEIFPNPVSETLHINAKDSYIESYVVYNLAGKIIVSQVVHQQNIKVDFTGFDRGVYLVKIMTTSGEFSKTIIK